MPITKSKIVLHGALALSLLTLFFSLEGMIMANPDVRTQTINGEGDVDIEIFTREGCPHCHAAKRFLRNLQAERPTLQVRIYEIDRGSGSRTTPEGTCPTLRSSNP